MSARMYDLEFEQLADGTVRMEQRDYCGETYVIDMHLCQLRHIAERVGLLPAPNPNQARLVSRIKRLVIDIGYVADDIWIDEIASRITDGLAYQIAMNNVLQDIEALAEDFDACQIDDEQHYGKERARDRERNENPSAISVTDSSETRKPGRPATGEAMSNAERQAKHREKQKEQDSRQRELDGMPG